MSTTNTNIVTVSKNYFVYLLVADGNNTYVGATVDLDHRLRQHNKEINGGAVASSIKVSQGESWTRACHVEGFPDWSAALQFEWRWKQLTRKITHYIHPLERRIIALVRLLNLERPTTKAIAYHEWEKHIEVVLEDDEARKYYDHYSSPTIDTLV